MSDKFGNKARAKAQKEKYLPGHNPKSAKGQGMKAKRKKQTVKQDQKNTTPKTSWKPFLGVRDKNKITALFAQIEDNAKATLKLIVNTAKLYYDAGNIFAGAISQFNVPFTAKDIAQRYDFPERKITLALKIFKHFENNPDALKGLSLRDALKLIAPPPPAGEDGYNRIDMGGDPGQLKLDFGELFEVPAVANRSLQNYRTVGDMVSEIIVVRRTNDGSLTSKRFANFSEDIPKNPLLRQAYKAMSQKTQAAIEDYLAALEQEEAQTCRK